MNQSIFSSHRATHSRRSGQHLGRRKTYGRNSLSHLRRADDVATYEQTTFYSATLLNTASPETFNAEPDRMKLRAMSVDYQSQLLKRRRPSTRKEIGASPYPDVEVEIVVQMQPKSRQLIKLQITSEKRAEPRVVFDPPEI